eukprot:scaffold7378_cov30-Phaeocystis_antarctica.AAC.2
MAPPSHGTFDRLRAPGRVGSQQLSPRLETAVGSLVVVRPRPLETARQRLRHVSVDAAQLSLGHWQWLRLGLRLRLRWKWKWRRRQSRRWRWRRRRSLSPKPDRKLKATTCSMLASTQYSPGCKSSVASRASWLSLPPPRARSSSAFSAPPAPPGPPGPANTSNTAAVGSGGNSGSFQKGHGSAEVGSRRTRSPCAATPPSPQ